VSDSLFFWTPSIMLYISIKPNAVNQRNSCHSAGLCQTR
jgi:hypothetical protein